MAAPANHVTRKGVNRPKPSFICMCGAHAFSNIGKGAVAFVSPQDRVILDRIGWFLNKEGYVVSNEGSLHRAVMQYPDAIVDHKDHDKLNCTRGNLRKSNASQSVFNKRKMATRAEKSSQFKGVNHQFGKWVARIVAYGKRENLGTFNCDTAAAIAYDKAARRLHGEFAYLNILGDVS